MDKYKSRKEFDAVEMMREIRTAINSEISAMSFEELRAYIDTRLARKVRLIGED